MAEIQTTLPLQSDATLPDEIVGELVPSGEPRGLVALEGATGLDHATEQANKLMHLVRDRGLAANIQGKEYLTVEAWCALGMWNGLASRTAWTKEIRDAKGELRGCEARVEVIRLATMDVVGAAEACCDFSEKMRGKSRWTDAHAVRAMAQTRATSRALAQILRFIPVLAGYAGTPAEDVQHDEPHDNPTPRADAPQAAPRGQRGAGGVTIEQVSNALNQWKACRHDRDATPEAWEEFVHRNCGEKFNVRKTDQWNATRLHAVLHAIQIETTGRDD